MVAVRVADLASPAREGLGKDGRTALVAAGAGTVRTGDLVVFCKPVAVAAAVVRRDGRVQAAGHLADHVRLGIAEQRLDALCGEPGVIGKVAAGVTLDGRVKGAARRAMTAAMVIRLVLLMTLMPGSCYAEAVAALLGDLPLVPWHRRYTEPTPRWPAPGGTRWAPRRWSSCGTGRWPASTPSTGTTTGGPSLRVPSRCARSTGR